MKTTDYAALVALDWGDKTHAFACQTAGSNEKQTGQIEASAEALHGWLETMHQTHGGRPVALAIEAGRNALLHALLEHPWLEIYPVHPATSARFRTAFTPSGAKDDGPDAEMLLTLLALHRDQLTRLQMDGPVTRELAALVSARRSAVDHRTQNTNQLRSVLKSYFPQALELVGQQFSLWVLVVRFQRAIAGVEGAKYDNCVFLDHCEWRLSGVPPRNVSSWL